MDRDQEFVEYIVKSIVDHPDEVVIKRSIDDQGILLELTVNPEDMGKIIGKEGRTAKSIRTLLKVLGAKTDERISFMIVEPGGSGRPVAAEGAGEENGVMPVASEEVEMAAETPAEEPAGPTEGQDVAQAAEAAMDEARAATDLEI